MRFTRPGAPDGSFGKPGMDFETQMKLVSMSKSRCRLSGLDFSPRGLLLSSENSREFPRIPRIAKREFPRIPENPPLGFLGNSRQFSAILASWPYAFILPILPTRLPLQNLPLTDPRTRPQCVPVFPHSPGVSVTCGHLRSPADDSF